MKLLRVFLVLSAFVFLFSCLGMENQYSINSNGSGRLVFQYRVSQMFKSTAEEDAEGAEQPPLPITKEEVEKKFSSVKGLKVISISQWEDESDIYVTGEVEFVSVNALNSCSLFEDMPVAMVQAAGKTTFVQEIAQEKEAFTEEDREALDLYSSFFEGYELVFSVSAPKKIISVNRGEISADGRSMTYRISMVDYIQLTEKTELRVTW